VVILSEFWRVLRRNESKHLQLFFDELQPHHTSYLLRSALLNQLDHAVSSVLSLKFASQISGHPEQILARFAPK